MISNLKALFKNPAVWVVIGAVAIGVAAFSKLRGYIKPVTSKIPGNDVAADL